MDDEAFGKLPRSQRMWLRADWARDPSRAARAIAKLAALASALLALPMLGALVVVALGMSERHQVRMGSDQERRIVSYADMVGPKGSEVYERYAEAARDAGLDSAWVPASDMSNWLGMGLPAPAREAVASGAAAPSAARYEEMARGWSEYKKSIREAAGPVQRCDWKGALRAGLPGAKPASQPGACQTVAYQGWQLSFLGAVVAGFLMGISACAFGARGVEWARWFAPDFKRSFRAWLALSGESSLARRERAIFAMASWRPSGSAKRGGRARL